MRPPVPGAGAGQVGYALRGHLVSRCGPRSCVADAIVQEEVNRIRELGVYSEILP
jgi:hypothetical protein